MDIKQRRESNYLSQEKLSEICGLSLRTVQRAESGHRVSYASLRALASAFDIDVDQLERELYAMENVVKEYKDYPFWVRFACGLSWQRLNPVGCLDFSIRENAYSHLFFH